MSKRGTKTKVANAKSDIVARIPMACADEAAAVELIEELRWDGSPFCPHCGSVSVYKMTDRKTGERSKRFLWRCREKECGKQFTVRVGTVMEDSRIPLKHWCYAYWRSVTSKKGVAALEIQRQTGLSYKSALFLMHRIKHAMTTDWTTPPKMSGIVETDELYIGGRRLKGQMTRAEMYAQKTPVVAMLERGTHVRAMTVQRVDADSISRVLAQHVADGARLMTDAAPVYKTPGKRFSSHDTVNHEAKEYARGDVTTNRVEGFFSLIRRGLHGIYHSVSKKHLHRYISEFEYRYNHRTLEDGARVAAVVRASFGKRLTYKALPAPRA